MTTRRQILKVGAAALALPALPAIAAVKAQETRDDGNPVVRIHPITGRIVWLIHCHGASNAQIAQESGVPLEKLRDSFLGCDGIDARELGHIMNALIDAGAELYRLPSFLLGVGEHEDRDAWRDEVRRLQECFGRYRNLCYYIGETEMTIAAMAGVPAQVVRDWNTGFEEPTCGDALRLGRPLKEADLDPLDYIIGLSSRQCPPQVW